MLCVAVVLFLCVLFMFVVFFEMVWSCLTMSQSPTIRFFFSIFDSLLFGTPITVILFSGQAGHQNGLADGRQGVLIRTKGKSCQSSLGAASMV